MLIGIKAYPLLVKGALEGQLGTNTWRKTMTTELLRNLAIVFISWVILITLYCYRLSFHVDESDTCIWNTVDTSNADPASTPNSCPLWWESTGSGGFPSQNASNDAKYVLLSWRYQCARTRDIHISIGGEKSSWHVSLYWRSHFGRFSVQFGTLDLLPFDD